MIRLLHIHITLIAFVMLFSCTEDLTEYDNLTTRASGVVVDATYISPNGDDSNSGSINEPVRSLGAAIALGKSQILLLEGEYYIDYSNKDVKGDIPENLTISANKGDDVTIVGVERVTTKWSLAGEGNIYVTEPNITPWQLFEDGTMLNAARYPNVDYFIDEPQPISKTAKEGSLWDLGRWVKSSSGSHRSDDGETGTIVVNESETRFMNDIDFSLVGGIGIVNYTSKSTAYTDIVAHNAGSNSFTFRWIDNHLGETTPQNGMFYLEGKLELLDHPGEWFYDDSTNKLYIYCSDGEDPSKKVIQGKTQSYAMTFDEVDNLTLSGLNFFGTTIELDYCANARVVGCTFSYPSYSKRMLRNHPDFKDDVIYEADEYGGVAVTTFKHCTNSIFLNCTFQYTESEAIHMTGKMNNYYGNGVYNSTLRHIDFSGAQLRRLGAAVCLMGDGNVFSNNTLHTSGAAHGIQSGNYTTITNNEIYGTGYLRCDGAIIHLTTAGCVYSYASNNWLHDTKEYAFRVDGMFKENEIWQWSPESPQTLSTFVNNVVWNTSGVVVKGDYHLIANNTLINTPLTVRVYNSNPNALENGVEANQNSLIFNNIAEVALHQKLGTLPDGVYNNVYNILSGNNVVEDLLLDVENCDFRTYYIEELINGGVTPNITVPEMGDNWDKIEDDNSDILGAYQYSGDSYLIPGSLTDISSSPIPADGAFSSSCNLMLAWKPADNSTSTNLYMGISEDDLRLMESFEDGNNCYYPNKTKFPINQLKDRYFWRVDCVVDGHVVTGKTWSFTLY